MTDRDCFWLNERRFARLEPHLPADTRGKPRIDDRCVVSGIVHVPKSGCCWIDAPAVYGSCKTLYCKRHKFENMFGRLKDWRCVHTRYGRCTRSLMSANTRAAPVIFWFKQ